MFLLNPSNDLDALEVNYKNSKLLEFSKIHYGPNSVVKSIDCFKKGT